MSIPFNHYQPSIPPEEMLARIKKKAWKRKKRITSLRALAVIIILVIIGWFIWLKPGKSIPDFQPNYVVKEVKIGHQDAPFVLASLKDGSLVIQFLPQNQTKEVKP